MKKFPSGKSRGEQWLSGCPQGCQGSKSCRPQPPGVRQGPASPIRLGLAATCTLHVGTVESVGAGTCPGVPRSLQQVRTPLITVSYRDADEHTDRLGLLTELLLALKVKANNNPSCSPWQERDAWLRAPTHGQAAGLDEQPRWRDALHCFQPGRPSPPLQPLAEWLQRGEAASSVLLVRCCQFGAAGASRAAQQRWFNRHVAACVSCGDSPDRESPRSAEAGHRCCGLGNKKLGGCW